MSAPAIAALAVDDGNVRGRDAYALLITIAAGLFCVITSSASWLHWAAFEYRTFDLAFYVQALWQLLHGRFDVSLLGVPLLGNHVEPIVFIVAPIFAVVRHPMTLVVVQNASLAAMGPLAYRISRSLGLRRGDAFLLALALLAAPASGFVALHEFHPEAFAAPLLLLLYQARLSGSIWRHWLWFVAVLSCKENMALLLLAYSAVHLVVERKRRWLDQSAWNIGPLLLALFWFVVATKVILPRLNQGNVDYQALYDRLGATPGDIIRHAFTEPSRYLIALSGSFRQGNLLPALLLPFLALPLFRFRWLLISTPLLLQHLLSWRSSEWMIYFHYAAPLLPLYWIATAEAVPLIFKHAPAMASWVTPAVAVSSLIALLALGPAPAVAATFAHWSSDTAARAEKQEFIARIPADASVTAPLPYLSHLAMRPRLYSLHLILKGLRTLSRTTYQPPPPTDYVLVDYADDATFDSSAGYYHPTMGTKNGAIIPSSDELMHQFLEERHWTNSSSNSLTLLRQANDKRSEQLSISPNSIVAEVGPRNRLLSIQLDKHQLTPPASLTVASSWQFEGERRIYPWMEAVFTPENGDREVRVVRGLIRPEVREGTLSDYWHVDSSSGIRLGHYNVHILFYDNPRRSWAKTTEGSSAPTPLCSPISLGELEVTGP